MEGTNTEKSGRLNLKMILISAGILFFLFVANVAMVVHAVNKYGDNREAAENSAEENTEKNEENQLGEAVRVGADCLKKHRGKLYVGEKGQHFLNVDYLHFALGCSMHSVTHDINEVGDLGGLLPCLIGELDVRNFIYYVEDGKECFVSEKEKFKLVYDETQEKWSTFSNAENIISSMGFEAGEWVPLYEYYSEAAYEDIQEAKKAAEEAEEKAKLNAEIDVLKNTVIQLQAGENTVTINPIEGYLPYSNESDWSQNGEMVVVMTKAFSYEDIVNGDGITMEEAAYTGNYDMLYNLVYSVRDSVEDTITIPDTGEVLSADDIVREVVQDSEGNEIIVLEGAHAYGYELEWRKISVEVYEYLLKEYSWIWGISAQDAYEALGYEGKFHYADVTPDHAVREYYKKLENDKYLCLTIENFDTYQEAYYLNRLIEFNDSGEADRYGTVGSSTYGSYYLLMIPSVPHDEFIRFLEDDCYTYE